ncbi:PSME3-interacting protein [Diachasma alloeum]|uniref:PSME3-interacting protein n=1 Tax=Diachasma alloeum TaxID=454923 RepID=UPI00073848CD|nr:PSME3-interacting protein [Diachasma alloeum]
MSSGFISEAELAEQRKTRQEEWNKVRTAEQPAEVSEEKLDRSLYDRLQEQKNKRDMEYEEAHKLKNMIKGLDDDEVEFLDLVDRTKLEQERKKCLEEEEEMRDFKARVAHLQEASLNERLKQELQKPHSTSKTTSGGSTRNSQHRLLAGVVVKKREKSQTGASKGTKRKLSDADGSSKLSESPKPPELPRTIDNTLGISQNEVILCEKMHNPSAFKCIGILPGLGPYDNSSDSECSSDSDHEHEHIKYDLLGRELTMKHENNS